MAAIYFDPEGYSVSGPQLMGRNSAGHSFLRGFMRYNTAETLHGFTETDAHSRAFHAFAAQERGQQPIVTIKPQNMAELSRAGTLYLPGPGLDDFARKRSLIDRRGWSLCGITHTTLSGRAMDAIAGLLTSPVEPWDALICTSRSVRETVDKVLGAEAEYLQHRLGATRFTQPRLPIIPLGINSEDFARFPKYHGQVRTRLGISEDEIVVLFVGRLSFHAKAHPVPMYRALEQSAQRGYTITLIECGWFANPAIEKAFSEAAAHFAPHVKRFVFDGRNSDNRRLAWHAADIFMSLTDNLQETFGITPIEAMASGLPVIVSDWDGYRDSVRDGIDGFCIPTAMPQPGTMTNHAINYGIGAMTYDYYCGAISHAVAVDIDEACKALDILVANPERRRAMGNAGRTHARTTFDWAAIIKKYEDLWAELSELRQSTEKYPHVAETRQQWPARMDPLYSFSSYPTHLICPNTRIASVKEKIIDDFEICRSLQIFSISDGTMPNMDAVSSILKHIPYGKSIPVADLARKAEQLIADIIPTIMFGLKIGTLKIEHETRQ